MKLQRKKIAQGMMEYILLIGIIVTALMAMSLAIKRGTQSIIKIGADQIGFQENAEQKFDNKTGFLNAQNTTVQDSREKQVVDRVGIINYIPNESTFVSTNTLTNGGFSSTEE